MISQIWVSNTT